MLIKTNKWISVMSVCMTGPCHQPLSARIWELWPAWPIRQCHNISRDDTRRCDRVIGDVTRLRSLDPISEHRDISLRDVPTCQSRPSENDSLCFLNSSVWIGIKQQDCWNTYIMNEEWMMFMRDMIACCLAALLASTWSVHYRDHYTSHQNINTPDHDNSTCHWGQ